MGLMPKNKGHMNFYECCDLTKKVYLILPIFHFYHHIRIVLPIGKCSATMLEALGFIAFMHCVACIVFFSRKTICITQFIYIQEKKSLYFWQPDIKKQSE